MILPPKAFFRLKALFKIIRPQRHNAKKTPEASVQQEFDRGLLKPNKTLLKYFLDFFKMFFQIQIRPSVANNLNI